MSSSVRSITKAVRSIEGFDVQLLDEDIMQPFRSDKKLDLSYDYRRAAPSNLTVSQWSRKRIPGVKVKVFDFDGNEVHGRTQLNTVRNSYA